MSGVLAAVIWDYDGTLADTRRRNFHVVRRLLAEAAGRDPDQMRALRSVEVYDEVNRGYANWRELYRLEFGFSEEETDRLGRLWTRYQLADDTPAPVFDGIATVLAALRFLGHGIVSMNGRRQILRSLKEANLHEPFRHIIGWEDVDLRRQKPEPDGILACLERVAAAAPGVALSVGDHETDVRSVVNARAILAGQGRPVRLVSIAACFAGGDGCARWSHQPEYVARHPLDVLEIAREVADGGR